MKSLMFKRFIVDPYYLLKYAITNFSILTLVILVLVIQFNSDNPFHSILLWSAGLFLFVLPHFFLIFFSGIYYIVLFLFFHKEIVDMPYFLLIPFGVLCGTLSAACMHNASHNNFKPKWLNRIVGEVCGIFQITGYASWVIAHMLHHSYPDHPNKDPHSPGNLTYSQFANSMGINMKNKLTNKYLEVMSQNKKGKRIWLLTLMIGPILRFQRVFLLMLLFGPAGFILFYLPFKIANALIYIDFNYRTHRPNSKGEFEILNLDFNLWYKFLNLISFGSYYHSNHHKNPSLFNPKYTERRKVIPVTHKAYTRKSVKS